MHEPQGAKNILNYSKKDHCSFCSMLQLRANVCLSNLAQLGQHVCYYYIQNSRSSKARKDVSSTIIEVLKNDLQTARGDLPNHPTNAFANLCKLLVV